MGQLAVRAACCRLLASLQSEPRLREGDGRSVLLARVVKSVAKRPHSERRAGGLFLRPWFCACSESGILKRWLPFRLPACREVIRWRRHSPPNPIHPPPSWQRSTGVGGTGCGAQTAYAAGCSAATCLAGSARGCLRGFVAATGSAEMAEGRVPHRRQSITLISVRIESTRTLGGVLLVSTLPSTMTICPTINCSRVFSQVVGKAPARCCPECLRSWRSPSACRSWSHMDGRSSRDRPRGPSPDPGLRRADRRNG